MTANAHRFDNAFLWLLENEGRLAQSTFDRGGRTWYGISRAAHPEAVARMDVAATDEERKSIAKEIYRSDYWDAVHADEFPWPIAFELFDSAVLHGPGTAVKFLQRACNVAPLSLISQYAVAHAPVPLIVDGGLGPKTLAVATGLASSYTRNLLGWMTAAQADYLRMIVERDPSQRANLWGWGRRLTEPTTPLSWEG